jgi:hypothetical protein
MIGRDNRVVPGLPIARIQEILKRHKRLVEIDGA